MKKFDYFQSKICEICNKKFYKRVNKTQKLWNEQTRFCSRVCTNIEFYRSGQTHHANKKRSITLIKKYKTDFNFLESRRISMIKSRHPKHAGHGAKISATRKRLYREGILSNALEKNPAWQGGKSFEKYSREFNNKLKDMIRRRDGFKCRICGCPQDECEESLIVHHIDLNKKNNLPSNLVSLCRRCHIVLHWKIRRGQIIEFSS